MSTALKCHSTGDAANPLVIGTMLHECIEVGFDEAIANYKPRTPS